MKRTFAILVALCLGVMTLFAQNTDTLSTKGITVDSTLVGKSVFSVLPSKTKVHQSQAISTAFSNVVKANSTRVQSGYRVRIFFDSKQTARAESENVLAKFASAHPGIPAYRSYQNPFFKVTVGDLRTRSEALQLLQQLKGEFPTAFVVKENINYPEVEPGL